jgi:hypothetical protein
MVSEIKRPPLWKGLYPPLRYMYVAVHCGLSLIVKYGTTISLVDCAQYSVQVNQCARPPSTLGGSTYPKQGVHSPYTASFLSNETWFCCLTIFTNKSYVIHFM